MSRASNSWHRIDEAFQQALEQDGDRADWIRKTFAESPEIRDEVLALLADVDRSELVVETMLASRDELIGELLHDSEEASMGLVGTRIGPFEVTDLIARGGMSVVYKARRVDGQWNQTVAIKVLPSWAGDENAVARLEAERQILSNLNHPNILPVLDGGETSDGYPYFVTAFVEGDCITDYVEKRKLSISQRLDLFREVASAVHYAHTKLITHRDIKPSNILVDASGRPHLLDFGIAKPQTDDDMSDLTVQGFSPMTVRYASPEQLAGESVTTASDVYQLGLLLHRLLTGTYPERSRDIKRAALHGMAESRKKGLKDDFKVLRGTLGLIVDKASRAEPENRYASAAALSDDIHAYLRGAAISARPETTLEILKRLMRRNPVGALSAALVFVLICGWLISLQLYSSVLEAERDFATAQAVRAERVKDVLTDVYRRHDPLQLDTVAGRPFSMLESLNIVVDTATRDLANEPDIQAELYGLFSALYAGAGAEDRAIVMLERAANILASLGQKALPELAEVEAQLGNLLQNTNRDASQAHFQRALDMVALIQQDAPLSAATVLADLAIGASGNANRLKAIQYFNTALKIFEEASLDSPSLRIELLFGLGSTLILEDRLSEAQPLLIEALQVSEMTFGPDHARNAGVLTALSSLERNFANLDKAIDYSRRAVAIMKRDWPENYESLLTARNDLALALGKARRFDESIAMLKDIVAIRRSASPESGSVSLATTLKNLATIQHMAGDYDDALENAREARQLMENLLPPDSAYQATPWFTMALIYLDSGDAAIAEQHAARSLGMLTPLLGDNHYQIHVNRCVLGETMIRQGRIEEGLALSIPAMAALRKAETRVARYEDRCSEIIAAHDR